MHRLTKIKVDKRSRAVNSVALSIIEIFFFRLRPVIFSEVDNDKEYVNNSMTIGTGLFELYIALQSIGKYEPTLPTVSPQYVSLCSLPGWVRNCLLGL